MAQELDDRQVRRGGAVGNGKTLNHFPTGRQMVLNELAHEARLAHARVAGQSQDSPRPAPGGEAPESFDLRLPADEARKAAFRLRLQTIARRGHAHQFEGIDGMGETFNLQGTDGTRLDESLDLAQGVR